MIKKFFMFGKVIEVEIKKTTAVEMRETIRKMASKKEEDMEILCSSELIAVGEQQC